MVISARATQDYISKCNSFLPNLDEQTLSIQKSSRPIESSCRVVTSAGLPLTVAVTGTLSMDVSAKAFIDIGSWMPHNFDPSIDVRGTLIPR